MQRPRHALVPRPAKKSPAPRRIAICTTSSRSRAVTPSDRARRARFNDLIRIGTEHLPHRNNPKQKSARQGQQQGDEIHVRVRIHRHIDRHIRDRLPCTQPAQQYHAAEQTNAPPASETSTASVSNCRRMRLRLDPSARRRAISLAPVCGASSKQAAQIRAGRQQNQPRQQHQPGNKGPYWPAQQIACQPRRGQGKLACRLLSDRSCPGPRRSSSDRQSLAQGSHRFQPPHQPDAAAVAVLQVVLSR